MKKLLILTTTTLIALSGCSSNQSSSNQAQGETTTVQSEEKQEKKQEHYLSFTDDLERKIVLEKKPERVIMLTPSLLDMFYEVGGTVVGAPTIPPHLEMDELRQKIKNVPDLGHFAENMEAVMGLNPDLVIGYPRLHDKYIDLFEQSNIPFAILRATTYEDTQNLWKLFGEMSGEKKRAEEVIADLDQKLASVKGSLDTVTPSVAILEVTTRDVTLERNNSITGNMVELLGIENIVGDTPSMEGRPDKVPFSMETLVEKDPDIILLKTMGPVDSLKDTFSKELEGNPAWKNLSAVKNKHLVYLPQELFLVHPGSRYGDSLDFLVKELKHHANEGR